MQELLFNDGPMTTANNLARVDRRSAQIDTAIIAESARWGDSRRSSPFDRGDWVGATNNLRSWISSRNNTLLGQLRARGWFPSIPSPSFNLHGGQISSTFDLFFSGSQGTIYYTTDGSDPRAANGSVSPSASIAQPSGQQVTVLLDQGAAARAFVPSDGSDRVAPPWVQREGTGGSGPLPEVDSRSDGNVNPGQG